MILSLERRASASCQQSHSPVTTREAVGTFCLMAGDCVGEKWASSDKQHTVQFQLSRPSIREQFGSDTGEARALTEKGNKGRRRQGRV